MTTWRMAAAAHCNYQGCWIGCNSELKRTEQISHFRRSHSTIALSHDANNLITCQHGAQPSAASKLHCFANLCENAKQREAGCLSSNSNYTRRKSSTMRAMSHRALTGTSSSYSSCNDVCTTTYNTRTTHMAPPMTKRLENDEVLVQELTVYEVNELDRGSPMLLSLSKLAVDWYNRFRVQPLGSLGDLVTFSNKLFDGSLRKRLGITAGMISVIRHYPKEDGLLFEAVYSFYFGDFGHISVKGPYKSHENTVLTVTGGSGIFTGVYGTVEIQNVEYPFVLFYRFRLHGIPPLPQALTWKTLPPTKGLRPSPTASKPGFALPNFTD